MLGNWEHLVMGSDLCMDPLVFQHLDLEMDLPMVALCVGTTGLGRCIISFILMLCVSTSNLFTLGPGTDAAGAVTRGGFAFLANVMHHDAGVVFSCSVGAASHELLLSKLSSLFSSSNCSSDFVFLITFSACDRWMIALEMTSAGDRFELCTSS